MNTFKTITRWEESRVPVALWTNDFDEKTLNQLRKTAALPFVFHHVAGMPDVHLGIGATVGSVIATKGAVCPAAVGVDIGCGMMAVKLDCPASMLDGLHPQIRHSIERGVPVGFKDHSTPSEGAMKWFAERDSKPTVASQNMVKKAAHSLGTLGGGNHFIELCEDEAGSLWVMLHSGSRGIGNKVASLHIDTAKGVMKRFFIDIPDPDLAYFAMGTPEFRDYVADVQWCQDYALENRKLMMAEVLRNLRQTLGALYIEEEINAHHNYLAWEHHFGENVIVTRKGAIRARAGELGIIPGSMGTGSFIVEGLGNEESFHSAPHGAGRRMSRTKARDTFTVEDLAEQTAGVECRKDSGVLDEIPGAYKPIGEVIENSSSLVKVVARLKQFVCVKG